MGQVMDFTKKFVKAKRPCADGFRWFIRHYEDGGDYQELLDALVADGRVNDACWLLDQFGPTDGLRVVDAVEADALVFAGTLEVRGNIDTAGLVRAGRTIRAEGGIRVGGSLIAGEDLRVGGSVRVEGDVDVGGDIRVGWGIEVLGGLRGRGDLRAGWDVRVTGPFDLAGNGFVGLDLQVGSAVRCGKGLQVHGTIEAEDDVRADHGIVAGLEIRTANHIEAGWGIKAGGAIVAGGAVRAGESLEAQEEIQAGDGYGVFAGLAVPVEAWDASARVVARARPRGLMSGWWDGRELC